MKLFYILLIVFFFIFITNLFLKPKTIIKYLGRGSGIRGWIISLVAGIISMGSIYLWYPMLSDLREKGMSEGLIAVFLYSRAVKIPILPVMIYYFGWAFVVLMTFFMVLFSIFLGIIMDRSSVL
ncbi:permease [candidate division WOR-3 bacterium]|nr:permease [candidate division WOR-3 bacterium]